MTKEKASNKEEKQKYGVIVNGKREGVVAVDKKELETLFDLGYKKGEGNNLFFWGTSKKS